MLVVLLLLDNSRGLSWVQVETLCKTRGGDGACSGANDAITTELLVCMHDIQQSNREGPQVLVLAATNRPQDIDVAIRRRFQKVCTHAACNR